MPNADIMQQALEIARAQAGVRPMTAAEVAAYVSELTQTLESAMCPEEAKQTPAVDPKKSPFRPAPTIMAKVVETVQTLDEKRTFTVPMYRQALVRSMDYDPQERSVHNGQSNNFVWNIKLRTEHQPKLFQESGTALYCSVPDQLV